MLVRNSSNAALKSVSGPPSELVNQDASWTEYKYRGDLEIFGEAEPAEYVYQVREGAVRTHKLLSDGRRQINAFHLRGDIFGVEREDLHRFTAEAVVHTTVWIAKRRSLFAGLATGDIPTTNNLRHLISGTLEQAEKHLLLLGRQSALEKVASFLMEMDRRLGEPEVMALPMARRDIADYLGLTIETVARALSILRDEGVLGFIGQTQRQIVLHDRRKLYQRVN